MLKYKRDHHRGRARLGHPETPHRPSWEPPVRNVRLPGATTSGRRSHWGSAAPASAKVREATLRGPELCGGVSFLPRDAGEVAAGAVCAEGVAGDGIDVRKGLCQSRFGLEESEVVIARYAEFVEPRESAGEELEELLEPVGGDVIHVVGRERLVVEELHPSEGAGPMARLHLVSLPFDEIGVADNFA